MDRDIRRPADPETAKKVAIERPHSTAVSSTSGTNSVSSPAQRYEEPVSEGEDDEYLTHPSHNEVKRLNLPPEVLQQARLAREEREQNVRHSRGSYVNKTDAGSSTYSSKTWLRAAKLPQPSGVNLVPLKLVTE
jgi:hypothetical protein